MTTQENESHFEIFGWEATEIKIIILFTCVSVTVLTLLRLVYEKTKMKQIFPESCLLIIVGIIIGAIITYSNPNTEVNTLQNLLTFPPDLFLQVFIPIIIFDATYFLNKHSFFHNFLEIVTYAIIGTLISTIIISVLMILTKQFTNSKLQATEILTYSSLISAVDPVAVISIMESMHVNQNIFNLAFGESTLNDGVAIVLFHLFKDSDSLIAQNSVITVIWLGIAKFIVSVMGAILVATIISFIFCAICRITYKIPNTEPILFMICMMCCYTLADMCLFSGVISVMTCAMIIVRYGDYNMSAPSLLTFQTSIHMLAQTLETLLFLDMGCQFAFITKQKTKIDFVLVLTNILFTFVARALGTIIQTFFLNFRRKKLGERLSFKDQIILIFSGLRGGIAFALMKAWPLEGEKSFQLVFTTCVLILFTMLVYGLSMGPLIKCLKIELQLHAETGYDFACKTIAQPAKNLQHFAGAICGKNNRFERFISKIDLIIQKIILKNVISMDRELIDNVEQIKQIQIEKYQAEEEAKAAQRKARKSLEVRARAMTFFGHKSPDKGKISRKSLDDRSHKLQDHVNMLEEDIDYLQ